MFPRSWRLTRQRDVQRVYRQGQGAASRFLFVRTLPNRLNQPRLAVIIGKKVAKKAVVRNRLKRLVRQAIQELMADPQLTSRLVGKDWIITIHREPTPPYQLAAMKAEVVTCFERLPLS